MIPTSKGVKGPLRRQSTVIRNIKRSQQPILSVKSGYFLSLRSYLRYLARSEYILPSSPAREATAPTLGISSLVFGEALLYNCFWRRELCNKTTCMATRKSAISPNFRRPRHHGSDLGEYTGTIRVDKPHKRSRFRQVRGI